MCLVYITAFSNKLCQHIVYPSCVFFGTVLGYNFLKYSKWFGFKNVFDKKVNVILSVSLVASIVCVFLFYRQEFFIQIHLFIALLLVVLYPSFRKIGWVKLFFVAFVVTFITVYIPLMNHEAVILISLQRFLLLSSVMIPFEISDSTTDSVALKTLPHWFGIQRTKQIGYVLVVLFCVVSFHALDCLYPCFIYALSMPLRSPKNSYKGLKERCFMLKMRQELYSKSVYCRYFFLMALNAVRPGAQLAFISASVFPSFICCESISLPASLLMKLFL